MAHGDDVRLGQAGAVLVEEAQDLGQAEAVVRHGLLEDVLGAVDLVDDRALDVADALDQAGGQRRTRVGVDELVLALITILRKV